MTSAHDPFAPYKSEDPLVVDADGTVVDSQGEVIEVPKGSSAEVIDWVDGDKEKAQLALDAENESARPRKGLVEDLKDLLSE